jgi:hypothetical protein
MAQSGHDGLAARCPLLGVKRTSPFDYAASAFDPGRTSVNDLLSSECKARDPHYRRGDILGATFRDDLEGFAGTFVGLYLPRAKSASWNRCSDWPQPNSFAAFWKAFTTSRGLALVMPAIFKTIALLISRFKRVVF